MNIRTTVAHERVHNVYLDERALKEVVQRAVFEQLKADPHSQAFSTRVTFVSETLSGTSGFQTCARVVVTEDLSVEAPALGRPVIEA